jgi:Domain of unknown function (DUF3473)
MRRRKRKPQNFIERFQLICDWCGKHIPENTSLFGGGGYFRLVPLFLTEQAIGQMICDCSTPVVMLYFHPWEFDPDQRRLPLGRLSRFRIYVGLSRTRGRLSRMNNLADVTRIRTTLLFRAVSNLKADLARCVRYYRALEETNRCRSRRGSIVRSR